MRREAAGLGYMSFGLSGAPMLMLPPEWTPGPVGDNAVIAWNGGREALPPSMTPCRCSNGRRR